MAFDHEDCPLLQAVNAIISGEISSVFKLDTFDVK